MLKTNENITESISQEILARELIDTINDLAEKGGYITGSVFSPEKDIFIVTNPAVKTYDLTYTPTAKTEKVRMNGLWLNRGGAYDYTISGKTITLTSGVILTAGDQIGVDYFRN